MMRLLVASALVASAPAASDTFAIACKGETVSTSLSNGKTVKKKFGLPDQIFVFSESSKVALRTMPRRSEFENLCQINPNGRVLDFSPDKIRAYWTSGSDWETRTTCEFKFDRRSGAATLRLKFEWSDSAYNESEWQMMCTSTQIPVFDSQER